MSLKTQVVGQVREALKRLGFVFFDQGDYNLNVIAIRSANSRAGEFDDVLLVIYKVRDDWHVHMAPFTTDPGLKYLKKPINPLGTAILASPQQIRGAYRIGRHFGRPALVQNAPFKVWRDGNRDEVLDWGRGCQKGWYGINLHDTPVTNVADRNLRASAGCQVTALRKELAALLDLVRKQGGTVTYTIIDEINLVE